MFNGAEKFVGKERAKMTVEKFLSASTADLLALLEQDETAFDSLIEAAEESPALERKLAELIDAAKKEEKKAEAELRKIKEKLYKKAEAPAEPECLRGFSETEKSKLMRSLYAIELTDGCSLACPNCGYSAKPGVRSTMSFGDLVYIFDHYRDSLRKPLPYYASDPLDWQEGLRNYLDAHEMMAFFLNDEVFISTGYPKGSQEIFLALLKKGYLGRLSVTPWNLARLIADGIIYLDDQGEVAAHDAKLQEMLKRGEMYVDAKGTERLKVGRAFRGTEIMKTDIGGIQGETGTLLRADGFYNIAICAPSPTNPAGVIWTKIQPDNLNKPVPELSTIKKIEDLLFFIIVDKLDMSHFLFERKRGSDEVYISGTSYAQGIKRRFLAVYKSDSHDIKYLFEIGGDKAGEKGKILNDVISHMYQMEGEKNDHEKNDRLVSLKEMMWALPGEGRLDCFDKISPEYEFLLEKYAKYTDNLWRDRQIMTDEGYYRIYMDKYFNIDDEYCRYELTQLKNNFDSIFQLFEDILPASQDKKIAEFKKQVFFIVRRVLRGNARMYLREEKLEKTNKLLDELGL